MSIIGYISFGLVSYTARNSIVVLQLPFPTMIEGLEAPFVGCDPRTVLNVPGVFIF
jgi:hypothetical protein